MSAHKPTRNAVLCTIHEIESWQLENKYLIGHYRRASHSYRDCFTSLGYLHNQTSNIYTHLLGTLVFLAWAVQTYYDVLKRYPTSDFNDFLVFGVFFICALSCFGFSACFHLFMHHSAEVNQTWLLFDLYGVFALIVATIFSGTYYAFYCERLWWKVYSGGVRCYPPYKCCTELTKQWQILSITFACAVFCTKPQFRHPRWRNVRAYLFISIGFYGVLPMTHLAEKWGRPKANEIIGWNMMFVEGLSYGVGAAIYAVSDNPRNGSKLLVDFKSFASLNDGGLEGSIFGARRIRFFMSLLFLELYYITRDSSADLTIAIVQRRGNVRTAHQLNNGDCVETSRRYQSVQSIR